MARRPDGERKRALIFETALRCFRERGFDATTMRVIAKEAGISLGSAYHYFPSKTAIVIAYYDEQQETHERLALDRLEQSRDLTERLTIAFQTKIDAVRADRALLIAVARSLADPEDPLSAFSEQSRGIRERAIGVFRRAIDLPAIAEPNRDLLAAGLWALHLATLAYLVRDDSPDQQRTTALVKGAVEVLTPILTMTQMPLFAPSWARLRQLLADAEIR